MDFDRFFFVILIVLFSLADMFIRWLKKRSAPPPPTGAPEEVVQADQEQAPAAGREWWEPEPELETVPQPSFEPPPVMAKPVALPPAPPAPAPWVPAPSAPPPRPRRKMGRRRAWLTHRDARRAIVLMAVLGPCRGMEPDRS